MSKRIFIDTNVMLDFLGERNPFYESIAKIATLAEKKKLTLVVSPISFAMVNYLLSKFENSKIAKEKLRKFKIISEICSLDEQTVEKGLNSSFSDFEDALQYYSATESECDLILTRNRKDFKKSLLPFMTPDEFIKSLINK
ncbi:MAG: PIN domain-containing protein [Psychroserpens sp.]|uniref:type II toxin-antitoxin system VapC family toxin n=1 Tax=Psychroserpens sp. TaxID=2020870 RepID=UPI003C764E37